MKNLAPDPEGYVAPEDQFVAQQLEAHFSNKGRAGKTVTIIKGFEGEKTELKTLAKHLKNAVGVGGTIKNGEIIIQGKLPRQVDDHLARDGPQGKTCGGLDQCSSLQLISSFPFVLR